VASRQPDHHNPDRVVCDRPDPAGRAAHADTLKRLLPGRCHDALNRLLRVTPLSTRSLMGLLVAWIRQSGMPRCRCLEDVVVEQAFAKRLRWAG
jgi:hypothetical protein